MWAWTSRPIACALAVTINSKTQLSRNILGLDIPAVWYPATGEVRVKPGVVVALTNTVSRITLRGPRQHP